MRDEKIPRVVLNNEKEIPPLGIGTFQTRSTAEDDVIYRTLDVALSCGFRLIDTASVYRNEKDIGRALKDLYPKHALTRADLFITSKLSPRDHGFEAAEKACLQSIEDLDCGYLDLYLIHWPGVQKLKIDDPKNSQLRAESWTALEKLHHSGVVKSIGVSNYTIHHLEELSKHATITPAVLQVEFHPQLFQKDLLDYCRSKEIMLQAYTSLGQGKLLTDSKIALLAEKYSRSPAQILLKWALQHNVGVIPKSTNAKHIKANIEVFDFEITEDDMNKMDSMNSDLHFCWDPTKLQLTTPEE